MHNLGTIIKFLLAIYSIALITMQLTGFNLGLSHEVLVAYFLGSIPFGLLLTKFFAKTDVRSIGSGNIGATNVLRTGNKSLAAATLLLDAAKGALAVLWLSPEYTALIGTACLLGHMYPVWLNFKGGKGVATAIGILIAVNWILAAVALSAWAVLIKITRISSLSSLIVVAALPVFAYLFNQQDLATFTLMMGVLIYIRHIENIKRILKGKENKVGDNRSA